MLGGTTVVTDGTYNALRLYLSSGFLFVTATAPFAVVLLLVLLADEDRWKVRRLPAFEDNFTASLSLVDGDKF